MNESQAVSLAKKGNEEAFEQLVLLYEKKIYNTALRYSGDRETAFDISQEVFLRVFRFISSFDERSSFSTWIYKITTNVCKDFCKKQTDTLSLDDEEQSGIEIGDETYEPSKVYERSDLCEQIASCISKLPEHYRQVVVMRDVNGMSYEQIAQVLELEQGTVKSRIARGREKLRKILQKSGNFSDAFKSKDISGR